MSFRRHLVTCFLIVLPNIRRQHLRLLRDGRLLRIRTAIQAVQQSRIGKDARHHIAALRDNNRADFLPPVQVDQRAFFLSLDDASLTFCRLREQDYGDIV